MAENLAAVLGMEVDKGLDDEEGGDWGSLLVLKSIGLLTQESETGITMLVDTCNGFNNMVCLLMLSTVRHHWPAGARLAFN